MGGMTDSGTPLPKVIKNIFGRKVFKIDTGDSRDAELVRDLQEALGQARRAMVEKPIQSKRPNEVGNYIEPYVLAALNQMHGYRAEKPKTQSGKGQSTGYPDILVTDMHHRASYLECKTAHRKKKTAGHENFLSVRAAQPGNGESDSGCPAPGGVVYNERRKPKIHSHRSVAD